MKEVSVVAIRSDIKEPYIAGSNAIAYDYSSEEGSVEENKQAPLIKKKISINPFYTLVLMSLVFLMLLICVMMLKAQFTVAATSEQVIQQKHALTAIRRENAHLESIIHEELDLVEIKRIAMEEYGMVFPTGSDVIEINPPASSYTVQYATIEAPVIEKTSIGNVLAFITRGW